MKKLLLCIGLLGYGACHPDDSELIPIENVPAPHFDNIWQPTPGTTFEWQLSESVNADIVAAVYDIDAFEATAAQVDSLHRLGRKVIAYLSVGTLEDWRPDADQFPSGIVGKKYDGWKGERWLDVRQIDQLAPMLRARLDMIKNKGFDGVEPDNLDGYEAKSGFDMQAAHAVAFCRWLSVQAHERGLSIGQKNVPELTPYLIDYFDWALTEDAYAQSWIQELLPYVDQDKAVFAAEYTDEIKEADFLSNVCPKADKDRISAVLKTRDLTSWGRRCK